MELHSIAEWWNYTASEPDRDAVLSRLGLDRSCAGIAWPFLPDEIRAVLRARVQYTPPPPDPPKVYRIRLVRRRLN